MNTYLVFKRGIFDKERYSASLIILILKFAFKAGSSKQGKALLASIVSKFVTATVLQY